MCHRINLKFLPGFLILILLAACNALAFPPAPSTNEAEASNEDITVSFDMEGVYWTSEELMTQADMIFAGKVLEISPTRWNQDSGEYWTETTAEGVSSAGEKLTTTHSAWPIYEIRMSVSQPIVGKVGVGDEVVLTLLGKSPLDAAVQNNSKINVQVDAESVDLQKGQELIVFAMQTEVAWRDPNSPIKLTTNAEGSSVVDIGNRLIDTLMGVYANAYLVKGSGDLYYPATGASNKQDSISLPQLIQEITQEREGLASP